MPLSEGVRRSPRARSARRAAADGRLSFDPLRQGCARLSAVCAACALPLPFPFELRCPSRSARRSGHSYVRSLMRRVRSARRRSEHEKCCGEKTPRNTIGVVRRGRGILIARESFQAHSRRLAEKCRNARRGLLARTAARHTAIMQEKSAKIRAPGRQSRDRRGAAV